ncbi:cysteine desulfurase family protein [uncultured Clostridium sp.]|uniref:cysteine desulfurase family protein n=1 Tax=uncultured Clostridium sp. TaxID=59620 RepID=UPI0025F7DCE6|nr:cysteine desulfurase family protein [uncultured Clostridium sp.]
MEAYFDNSATTKVLDCVKDAVVDAMCVNYGNAAAKHRKGVEAENLIREAKKAIADTLKVQEKEILFTSGGTESNNTALIGTALANRRAGKHLITTGVEHPSIYNTMSFLEEMGFEITYLPVDHLGHISLEDLENAIREDTILVSVMYVNNEVGAVEPIEAISQCIKKKNPKTLFHVDAIQAYGKYKIRPKKQGIDLLSVSGHKIHAPKGVGFLYIRDGVKIRPILFGGGQQKGMRSGTENVPGCVGLGVAAREAYKDFDARIEKLYTLRERLIAGLKPLGGVTINGSEDRTNAPQIVSASFEGIRSEVLLHALEDKGVYVSSGSACSSNHPGISGTLKGIGVKKELLDSTIRFSLGDLNTEEEVDYAIGVLGELLPVLRRYQMK